MNPCSGLPADQFAEDYILGTLPEADSAAFEDHYFACPVCLGRLEALQAAREQLQSHPVQTQRAPIPWPSRIVAVVAIAATLIAVAFVYLGRHKTQQNDQAKSAPPTGTGQQAPGTPETSKSSVLARSVSSLADLNLPVYRVLSLRGPAGDPAYEEGMKAYASQDCPAARRDLAEVPAANKLSLAARFYTGVCLMHEGKYAEASVALQKVAGAGDTPQQEAAFYYLAQIAAAQNDPATARQKLEQTIALRGDFEKRARTELATLQNQISTQ